MSEIILICEPDENGVYRIGDRYVNVKVYKQVKALTDYARECPACSAYQKASKDGKCVVCGYDIARLDIKDFVTFKEKNKEKIEDLKKNYGRKIDPDLISEYKRLLKKYKSED